MVLRLYACRRPAPQPLQVYAIARFVVSPPEKPDRPNKTAGRGRGGLTLARPCVMAGRMAARVAASRRARYGVVRAVGEGLSPPVSVAVGGRMASAGTPSGTAVVA